MSVGGHFISLNNKAPMQDDLTEITASNLYGITIAGFYNGHEIAYKKYNGRWRAGFNFSNLRGNTRNDNTYIKVYALSLLKVSLGFDFIFNQDNLLAVTTEYKKLLDNYTENRNREKLNYDLEGVVIAAGFEYVSKEKIVLRTGYSRGINRLTDSFASIGAGFKANYAEVDISFLICKTDYENSIRNKLRISISLNLEAVFLH